MKIFISFKLFYMFNKIPIKIPTEIFLKVKVILNVIRQNNFFLKSQGMLHTKSHKNDANLTGYLKTQNSSDEDSHISKTKKKDQLHLALFPYQENTLFLSSSWLTATHLLRPGSDIFPLRRFLWLASQWSEQSFVPSGNSEQTSIKASLVRKQPVNSSTQATRTTAQE